VRDERERRGTEANQGGSRSAENPQRHSQSPPNRLPGFQLVSSGSNINLVNELDQLRSGLLAQAQTEYDYTILEDLHNQLPAGEEYKHKITAAITSTSAGSIPLD